MSSVVHLSSVTRVYCDKTAEARITQFSLVCSSMLYLPSMITKFEGSLHDLGSNWDGVVSEFAMLYLGDGAR